MELSDLIKESKAAFERVMVLDPKNGGTSLDDYFAAAKCAEDYSQRVLEIIPNSVIVSLGLLTLYNGVSMTGRSNNQFEKVRETCDKAYPLYEALIEFSDQDLEADLLIPDFQHLRLLGEGQIMRKKVEFEGACLYKELSVLYANDEKLTEAQRYREKAKAMYESIFKSGKIDSGTGAKAMINYGNLFEEENDFVNAAAIYTRVISTFFLIEPALAKIAYVRLTDLISRSRASH